MEIDEISEKSQTYSQTSEDGFPWVEKYRPHILSDLISHEDIISTINKLIDADKLPHLLLYGPPGTGKTSTILACAQRMYGKNYHPMILELNASDDRGIDVVRNEIKSFASSQKLFSTGVKLVILDESDNMTNTAQFALRRIIEQYSRTTRFCLICNYVNQIIPALQSRCTKFRFAPLHKEQIVGRLEYIATEEHVNMTEDGKQAILDLAEGDMRRVLNILQSTSMAYPVVNSSTVYLCTGCPLPEDINQIKNWLLNDTFQECYDKILTLKTNGGLALHDILTALVTQIYSITFPPKVLSYLLKELAELEYRVCAATSESMQLSSLVGIFNKAKNMMSSYTS